MPVRENFVGSTALDLETIAKAVLDASREDGEDDDKTISDPGNREASVDIGEGEAAVIVSTVPSIEDSHETHEATQRKPAQSDSRPIGQFDNQAPSPTRELSEQLELLEVHVLSDRGLSKTPEVVPNIAKRGVKRKRAPRVSWIEKNACRTAAEVRRSVKYTRLERGTGPYADDEAVEVVITQLKKRKLASPVAEEEDKQDGVEEIALARDKMLERHTVTYSPLDPPNRSASHRFCCYIRSCCFNNKCKNELPRHFKNTHENNVYDFSKVSRYTVEEMNEVFRTKRRLEGDYEEVEA